MKVLDLQCEDGHSFEGWFADEQAFVHQQSVGLIACPLCGSHVVQKMLSAPRLNLGAARAEPATGAGVSGDATVDSGPALARWHARARELIAATENVGDRFISEAQAMHDGDLPQRPIRGIASAAQVKALADDGVEVFPVPASLIEPLH